MKDASSVFAGGRWSMGRGRLWLATRQVVHEMAAVLPHAVLANTVSVEVHAFRL